MVFRGDGRGNREPRKARITPGYLVFAEGSALIEAGNTRVLCAVSVEDRVPSFMRGSGRGWVTAEYGMLPRATPTRNPREGVQGRERGRSHEIQRLIGRTVRAVTNLEALGERSFIVDCDVLQADGGTRTAAITGSYVALYQAFLNLYHRNILSTIPFNAAVAAISVGVVDGEPLMDLCYEEDFRAQVDFNVAMTSHGEFVEVQGTAEGRPFSRATVDDLLSLASEGITYLLEEQKHAIQKL
ncbi:MAG: ribonuclease PH [Chloroflexi bacterium]|nr:ribonuclease PH [Chloroflexota bacterium]